jgi:hypothetical protein
MARPKTRSSGSGNYALKGSGIGTVNDEPVWQHAPEELTVISEVMRCRDEAWDAKQSRLRKNSRNMDAYLGRQDWSYKQEGQSTEFIPKTSVSVESMGNFIKRGLIKFGDYYSVETDYDLSKLVSGAQLRAILNNFLNDLWEGNNKTTTFPLIVSDAIKMGLLNSLIVMKVHGGMAPSRKFGFVKGKGNQEDTLQMEEDETWKLRIDLVKPEDYYPDPTGAGLYEIHSVERDLHEVMDAAEQGIYDKEVVAELIGTDYEMPEDEKRSPHDLNQDLATFPGFRKRVVLDEFWGTLLKADGTVAHRNCVCTVANKRFLIRKPEPNPFWHQESPFVAEPIVRIPWGVWGKALFDDAVALNLAQNELFNLILDGGMAAVWGTRQIRLEDLEDPGQVAGGLKQGMTLAVKQTLPHNAKVVELCATGDVPQDAMQIYEALDREFNAAVYTNELKLGSLPSKQVRATEVIESSNSQAITLDGLTADLERKIIDRVLYLSWMNVLQNADEFSPKMMTSVTNRAVANIIMRASPEERFALFGGKVNFRTFGLSATMAKALDFQKFMAMMQAVQMNPMLFQAFMMKFSPDRALTTIMTKLNINPDDLQMSPEEMEQAANRMQETLAVGQMMGNGQGGQKPGNGASAPGATTPAPGGAPLGGGSSLPASINQGVNPTTGLVPNA